MARISPVLNNHLFQAFEYPWRSCQASVSWITRPLRIHSSPWWFSIPEEAVISGLGQYHIDFVVFGNHNNKFSADCTRFGFITDIIPWSGSKIRRDFIIFQLVHDSRSEAILTGFISLNRTPDSLYFWTASASSEEMDNKTAGGIFPIVSSAHLFFNTNQPVHLRHVIVNN